MGRGFRPVNYFAPHESNTICDITGFKVKTGQTLERWEGFHVIQEAWHPRQPQDFPVIPVAQKIHKNVRTQSQDETAAASFDII
jgi:hypothetical protein